MLTERCDCPICGFSENTPFAFEPYKIRGEDLRLGINRCTRCSLIYTSPRLSRTGLEYLYHNYTRSASGAACIDESIQFKEYQEFYQYVRGLCPQGGKLLDMGCGVGNFLMLFKDNPAFDVQGVDLSDFAVSEAGRRGLRVIQGDVGAVPLPDAGFDVISLLYVLEHVPDPVGVLKEARRLLRPGGLAIIGVPNYNLLKLYRAGLICRLLYKRSTFLEAQEHLINFTVTTLSAAVQQVDLVPLQFFCGSPAAKGNPLIKMIRFGMGVGLKTLFHLGVHLGRIHLIAQKREVGDQ